MPVLRGTALRVTKRRGFLWTKGFTPRLRTYPGWEVPNPLAVDVHRAADLRTVMEDVVCLTKVNFNACVFSDGLSGTLKFADVVGEILTAARVGDLPPLPFRHYIWRSGSRPHASAFRRRSGSDPYDAANSGRQVRESNDQSLRQLRL